jgi:hypothetical protein
MALTKVTPALMGEYKTVADLLASTEPAAVFVDIDCEAA